MKYFMYANGMPFDGNTINEEKSLGGSESMAYYVAKELAKRQHSVFMFCNMPDNQHKVVDGVNYFPIGQPDQQKHPFGINYERYVQEIPCDVHIAQRAAGIFSKVSNSKLNYFWAHDLALKRFQGNVNSMLWNTDRFLGVSEFHKKQIMDVYHIPEDMAGVLRNGIDSNLWAANKVPSELKIKSKTMLYAARPERGLINLVKPDGIMERLFKFDPEIKLLVCGYDNQHPQMQAEYNYLYQRCHELPNVQNIGFLSKQALAQVEMGCWLYVYPTDFEDTSCLMVMENAAAGTPFITCKKGALEETADGSGVYWSNIESFEKAIIYLSKNPDKWKALHKRALEKATDYRIENTVDALEQTVEKDFANLTRNKQKLYDHFVYTSEIYGADKLKEITVDQSIETNDLRLRYKTDNSNLKETVEFYDITAQRNFDLGNKHGMEDPSQLLRMGRLQPVIQQLSKLPPDARVLDYGCCVGQLTFALKSHFQNMHFTGVDISKDQIDIAEKYKEDNEIKGIQFHTFESPELLTPKTFDAVICLEVLEHVWDHTKFLQDLSKLVVKGGKIIISTPLGPYEENSEDPDPLYQHLHNFEEQDILDIVGEKKDVTVTYVAEAPSKKEEKLGNYAWGWTENHDIEFGEINWDRKFKIQRPREQVTACMIIRPDGGTLKRCLDSIAPLVDELIVGVDDKEWLGGFENKSLTSEDELAYQILRKYDAKVLPIESPMIQGFAEARNKTIEKATKDWILWVDDDETFVWPERFNRFLRNNHFDSYGISHHHISADPVGLLKTDYPTRVFRNGKNIQFFGIVHEHPETEINKGPGKTFLIPEQLGCIMHYGYETEEIRRKRFGRNYPLMVKDRELNPERKLGKFLWIRDMAHMNRFEMEHNGNQVTDVIIKRCKDTVDLWRSELDTISLRMVRDSMPYITECVHILTKGAGIQFKLGLDINSRGMGDNINAPITTMFQGMVENKEDLAKLQELLLRDKLNLAETSTVYI